MEEKIEKFIDFLRQEERSENTIDTYAHKRSICGDRQRNKRDRLMRP